jgi:hypothetical protein
MTVIPRRMWEDEAYVGRVWDGDFVIPEDVVTKAQAHFGRDGVMMAFVYIAIAECTSGRPYYMVIKTTFPDIMKKLSDDELTNISSLMFANEMDLRIRDPTGLLVFVVLSGLNGISNLALNGEIGILNGQDAERGEITMRDGKKFRVKQENYKRLPRYKLFTKP